MSLPDSVPDRQTRLPASLCVTPASVLPLGHDKSEIMEVVSEWTDALSFLIMTPGSMHISSSHYGPGNIDSKYIFKNPWENFFKEKQVINGKVTFEIVKI